jgi:D-3-phosphoglycerate dehydrogenase
MTGPARVAVASHSFSSNVVLREELLARYGEARFNETRMPLTGSELIQFLRGATMAITGLETLDETVFAEVPETRLFSKYGVGLDMIDLEAARRHGVRIRWTPGVNRQAVAELALGFMIALLRDLFVLGREVSNGTWRHHRGGRQLSTATVGVVGCGHVGQSVARLCRAFGARLLAHDIVKYDEFYREVGVTPVPLDLLLRESDVVTLHVPLDRSTRGLIGGRELATMKRSAFLVNTARGGIVDEAALRGALESGGLAGAAFDVFGVEPPVDRGLLALPNFIATPHVGGGTQEAVLAMGRAAIRGLEEAPETVDLASSNI